jgi:hypothetical protein
MVCALRGSFLDGVVGVYSSVQILDDSMPLTTHTSHRFWCIRDSSRDLIDLTNGYHKLSTL